MLNMFNKLLKIVNKGLDLLKEGSIVFIFVAIISFTIISIFHFIFFVFIKTGHTPHLLLFITILMIIGFLKEKFFNEFF